MCPNLAQLQQQRVPKQLLWRSAAMFSEISMAERSAENLFLIPFG